MQRVIGLFVFILALVAGWYWMAYQHFLQAPLQLPAEGLVIQVERGTNLRQLARRLEDRGVLANADLLYWHARWHGLANRIRAGEFLLPAGTTPPGLLEILISGRPVEYRLTLLEGWTFRQVMAALARDPVLEKTLTDKSPKEVMAAIGHPGEHPEGRFFPDTYSFPRGTTDVQLLRRAYDRMQQVLAEAWARRAPDIAVKTPYEALILASIVEKETGAPEERAQIAGVFERRLRKGMKLQTDPTVIYGMGERYQGNIRRSDLREDTPYNTYVHKGLPPTPICMPGREAIEAVLHPADGSSLYFVARGDGTHVFSDTLEAHNRAVRRYQLKR
ncbi:MAG: endolytic transglycosylase MltG [Gammaproteobacteria bacterium]|nr:MAG: endolytic transglycosylase MltG [Gammaproteobacteria bacterium]